MCSYSGGAGAVGRSGSQCKSHICLRNEQCACNEWQRAIVFLASCSDPLVGKHEMPKSKPLEGS